MLYPPFQNDASSQGLKADFIRRHRSRPIRTPSRQRVLRNHIAQFRVAALVLGNPEHAAQLGIAEQTGADPQVVELFAFLHDSQRLNDGRDPQHGARAARFAATLRGSLVTLPDDEFELLRYACAFHTDGLIEADVTVQTCWDADRLDLGRIGVMPDPLAGLAVQQGAVLILDDANYPQYGFSVISFRKAVLDAHPEAVRGFLAAIEEATALVNANPEKYTTLLSDNKLVPEPLLQTYQVPPFPLKGVPTKAEWQDALEWAKSKDLIDVDVSYADSVVSTYLP